MIMLHDGSILIFSINVKWSSYKLFSDVKLCSSYALKDVDGVDNQQDLGMKLWVGLSWESARSSSLWKGAHCNPDEYASISQWSLQAASLASLLIIFVTYSSLPMHSYGLDGLESIIIFKYPPYIACVPIAKVIMDYRTSNPCTDNVERFSDEDDASIRGG